MTKSKPVKREHKRGSPFPGYLLRDSPTHPTKTTIENFYCNLEVDQHDQMHPDFLLFPFCRKGKKNGETWRSHNSALAWEDNTLGMKLYQEESTRKEPASLNQPGLSSR
ncbi:unnamed protein product [Rangifer tarandus platyrhynchus]|uniref:Uncharacterized protein n=2 Tax=Rangifer tarandus platyrhynchus TaxID=3082113 RepID=A0ABN8ZX63_RANTA|nr:unnamed protein product [Rangifer tarandus platyrhynchus]